MTQRCQIHDEELRRDVRTGLDVCDTCRIDAAEQAEAVKKLRRKMDAAYRKAGLYNIN